MKDWFKPWLGNRLRDLPIKAVLTLSADDKYYSENEDNGHRWNFAIYLKNTSKSANGDRPYLTYINEDGQEVVARGLYNYISDGWIYFEGNSGSNLFASWEYPNIYVHGDFSVLQIQRGHFENINVSNTSIDSLQTSALRYKDTNRSVVYNIQACNCSQLTDGGDFYVRDTHIKSVDVSGSALNYVNLYSNTSKENVAALTSVVANDMPNLEWLQINYQTGTTAGIGVDVQIKNCPNFTTFYAWHSTLGNVEISDCKKLNYLYLNNTNKSTGTVSIRDAAPLDKDGLVDLHIEVNSSGLTSSNLEEIIANETEYIKTIGALNGHFDGELDLSGCINMSEFINTNNYQTTLINLSGCHSLLEINMHYNQNATALKTLILPTPSSSSLSSLDLYGQTKLVQISTDGGKTYTQEPDLAYPNLVKADLHGWSQSLGNIQLGTYDNAVLSSVNVNSSGISGVIAKTCYNNQNAPTLTYASTTRLVAIERAKNLTSFNVLAGVVSLTLKYCGITALDCSAATGITTVDITGSAICADASALTAFAKTLPDYSDGTKGGRVVVGDWMTAATQDALTASLPGGWQLQTYAIGPDDPTPLDA